MDNKTVTLTFGRKSLLYDISNISFVEGDVMNVEDEHSRHQTIDISQDGNVDRVTRTLDLAYCECKEFLYPYTKEECEDGYSGDNGFEETENYVIKMSIPPKFSKTTYDLLLNLIHEYMICRVLYDWLGITDPQAASKWREKYEAIEKRIRACVGNRIGRTRIRQSPF